MLTVSGWGAEYSCDGELVPNINTANSNQNYSTSLNATSKDVTRYFRFSTQVDGEITISFDVNNNKNQKLRIGSTCGGNDIYGSGNKQSASKTFDVTAGTTYYQMFQETNNDNELDMDISFVFTADASAVTYIENANDICALETDDSALCFFNCTKTITLKSLDDIQDVKAAINTTGFVGTFVSDCGVNGVSGKNKNSTDIGFCADNSSFSGGPFTILSKGINYNVANSMVSDSTNSIYDKAFMSMSFFSTDTLYASYIKDGINYRGQVATCSLSPALPADETIPSNNAVAEEPLCNTFADMFQTHGTCTGTSGGTIEFTNGGQLLVGSSSIILENNDNALNTCQVTVPTWVSDDFETCGTQGDCEATGSSAEALSVTYSNPPATATVSVSPSSSTTDITLASNQTLSEYSYDEITTDWHTGISTTFTITNSLLINSLKMTTDNTFLFTSSNPYNLEIGTLGIQNNGATNTITTDTNAKNIKINTFNLVSQTSLALEAAQTIKMQNFTVGRGSNVTLKAQYVNINNFTSSNSGSGDSVINIYADYIDISTLTLGQTVTLNIYPFTAGGRVLFRTNTLSESSSSSIHMSSGNYYVNTSLVIPGTSDISAMRAIDADQLINLYIGSDLTLGNNPGINAIGNKGNYDASFPAANFMIFINGDLTTGGGGTTINATIYVEGKATFGNPTYIKGALSATEISIGQGQFTYDQSIDDATWGECAPTSYCQANNLSSGFHIIDPTNDGDSTNAFEIYCDRSDLSDIKDVVKLPISFEMSTTEFSNFTFNSSISADKNYYNTSYGKTPINYIRINAYTMEVIPDNSTGFYNGFFSNINLRGTPFTFDWENLSDSNIGGCELSKMRLDYDSTTKSGGQTLKINPKLENVYKCSSNTLKLKLLDEYKYITYLGSEVLEESCKVMSASLPDVGDFESISGYYYIDPKNVGRSNNQNLSDYRPFVTYCMEVPGTNPEDQYSWTMFLNLDGKRTFHHDNIKDGIDTCTNLGLIFFVPNTQITFNKVKDFLYSQKDQWKDYTGKMNEYFTDRNIAGWGTSNETSRYYWPYGPMGLYYDGAVSDWDPTITDGQTISSYKYGYDLTSTSAVGGFPINIAHLINGHGWTTTLEDLKISNDFWITNFSAGGFKNSAPVCSGGITDKCYLSGSPSAEPNGNYNSGNWMHFWADDNGDIYHYNDQNNANKYTHDHYMCIAEDNYETFSRFGLTEGPFKVIESGQTITDGAPVSSLDLNITTKIVKEPLDFDIVTFDIGITEIDQDQNISAGLFLSTDNGAVSNDLHYFGKIGGLNPNFDTSSGSAHIDTAYWPSASNKIIEAYKRLFFQFKYCSQNNLEWSDCWTHQGNAAICTSGCTPNDVNCLCKTSESNDFAMRPDKFGLSVSGNIITKAQDVNIIYYANDYEDSPTINYNETLSSFSAPLAHPSKISSCPETELDFPLITFTDGIETNATTLVNVGIFHVQMKEDNGSEYAIVDVDDTPDIQRFITPSDINLTIIPHHFKITPIIDINHGNNFTYLSNDLDNMALKFDFNVTAENNDSATTPNYTSGCYANVTNIDLNYSSANIPAALAKLFYKELISTKEGNVTATTNNVTNTLPATIFTSDNNGTAQINLRVNFSREKNSTINPFIVNFNDLNISDQTYTASGIVAGTNSSGLIDVNATMVYGRTHASRQRYEGNTSIPATNIYYESYCFGTDCNKTVINGFSSTNTDDIRWFINTAHTNADGNPGIVTEKNSLGQVTAAPVDTITNPNTVVLTYHGTDYPYKTTMENNASNWLIYNKDNPTAPRNQFSVEFYKADTGWSGAHETNTTTKDPGTATTNRRSMW